MILFFSLLRRFDGHLYCLLHLLLQKEKDTDNRGSKRAAIEHSTRRVAQSANIQR